MRHESYSTTLPVLFLFLPQFTERIRSILVTELRKIISSSNLKVLIVDDEDPEMRAAGLGDSHGKCSSEVLRMMSENVPRQSPEGEKNTPLQVRIGFPGKFLFKGTIVSFSNDITPPSIVKKYGGDWDLILPTSGIKGNKPAVGTQIINKTIYLGNVHFAENRDAVASQQFWMWYTAKAIKKDFAKVARKYNIKRVQTAVRSDFDKGIRFAKWLGLENEGLMKHYGFDGSDQYRYARIF